MNSLATGSRFHRAPSTSSVESNSNTNQIIAATSGEGFIRENSSELDYDEDNLGPLQGSNSNNVNFKSLAQTASISGKNQGLPMSLERNTSSALSNSVIALTRQSSAQSNNPMSSATPRTMSPLLRSRAVTGQAAGTLTKIELSSNIHIEIEAEVSSQRVQPSKKPGQGNILVGLSQVLLSSLTEIPGARLSKLIPFRFFFRCDEWFPLLLG